ncbi:hypothetical protein [Bacillus sp. V5-8f]|uniref:hypothetical protein n=1 Tax=Bacillus sp. V5-8f TaxID=2053044 RepID=UPI000C78DA13|nr:hypothetical protein [Bacillus sp. V5-8f]PLT32025.1 hypothetical protein CUU64_20835 [Bacillus sp. V5-8f]
MELQYLTRHFSGLINAKLFLSSTVDCEKEVTVKIPQLDIPPGRILDGEFILVDHEGKLDFEAAITFDVWQREGGSA